MKDIVITGASVRRELRIFLCCLLVGCLVNVGAIQAFGRPWSELITQIGYVLVLALGLYLIVWIIRLIVLLIRKLLKI